MGSFQTKKPNTEIDLARAKKLSFLVNSVVLFLVFALAGFFWICKVPFLVWFSIPTALVYVIGYWLIAHGKLSIYVHMVYSWLTLYMGITTICLGYSYGFHLYCFSIIPTIYVAEYIGYRLNDKSLKPVRGSLAITVFAMLCTGYAVIHGPIFPRDQKYAAIFWIVNSVTVFAFLIFYSKYLIDSILRTERELIRIAHIDKLTDLYNRHYMLDRLEALPAENTDGFIAMADIDDFKKINDTYGHNAGDLVLQTISERMRSACENCEIARWGGEEFLILSFRPLQEGREMLEQLRQQVAKEPIVFEEHTIHATLTIGIGSRQPGQSIDAWIQSVDEKLYFGKNNGKNRVVE